jgi:hypothetical protein
MQTSSLDLSLKTSGASEEIFDFRPLSGAHKDLINQTEKEENSLGFYSSFVRYESVKTRKYWGAVCLPIFQNCPTILDAPDESPVSKKKISFGLVEQPHFNQRRAYPSSPR